MMLLSEVYSYIDSSHRGERLRNIHSIWRRHVAVAEKEYANATPRAILDDPNEIPERVLIKSSREVKDDQGSVGFSDLPCRSIELIDGLIGGSEVLLNDQFDVSGVLTQSFDEVRCRRPNLAPNQVGVVFRQLQQTGD